MTATITIIDRNEIKALFAWGFNGKPSPRDKQLIDFMFEATDALFEARRAYSLNASVQVLNFIAASKFVDKAIYDHRSGGDRHDRY
jgi:hypothetical protein